MSEDPDRFEAELAKVRQAIAAQEALCGIIPDDQLQGALDSLLKKEASLLAEVSGTGAIAQGAGAMAITATEGAMAIGNVQGNVYLGPPAADPLEALSIYRRVLLETSGSLPLRGLDMSASDPTAMRRPLNLINVYIGVDTTEQVPVESNEKEKHDRPLHAERGETRPLSALEAVVAHRHLVLLGEPGGGKSTFANHLAYCLAAQGLESSSRWLQDHLAQWPSAEANTLPLVVILRDFAQSVSEQLPQEAQPDHLWQFIEKRLACQRLAFAAAPIEQVLEKGQAMVLLDGLDEVTTAEQRTYTGWAVAEFIRRYPANRFLVTCRTLSYQPAAADGEADLRLPIEISTCELAPFDETKIDRFVEAWYNELTRVGTVRGEDRDGLTRELRTAVRRPDLWRIAPNPLLLTVMALVHAHKGRLPDARSLLYEETVDILLWRWEQIKAGGQAEVPRLRRLLQIADRTDMDLRRILWRLAYEAHARGSAADYLL